TTLHDEARPKRHRHRLHRLRRRPPWWCPWRAPGRRAGGHRLLPRPRCRRHAVQPSAARRRPPPSQALPSHRPPPRTRSAHPEGIDVASTLTPVAALLVLAALTGRAEAQANGSEPVAVVEALVAQGDKL